MTTEDARANRARAAGYICEFGVARAIVADELAMIGQHGGPTPNPTNDNPKEYPR